MDLQTALKLQQLRKEHGLSQEELADQLGVSRQAVSKWERAESSPDTDNLICLARLYNVSLDELLDIQTDVKRSTSTQQTETPTPDCNDGQDDEPKSKVAKMITAIIPVVCIVAYLIVGAITGAWHPAWLITLAIPILESLVIAIEQKTICAFVYPVLCAAVYLCFGFLMGNWDPSWIVFLTIPIFYVVGSLIDNKGEVVEE